MKTAYQQEAANERKRLKACDDLPKEIKAAITRAGYTIPLLAVAMGVNYRTLYRQVNNPERMGYADWAKLNKFIHIDPATFLAAHGFNHTGL